jgi:nucleoid-associated protein YgaU
MFRHRSASSDSLRLGLLVLVAGACIGVGVALLLKPTNEILTAAPGAPAVNQAATPAVPPGTAAADPAVAGPSFDVVLASPQGGLVMAGRAAPGATVTISDGEHEVGQATADARGDWVLTPGTPLPPGQRQLTLSALLPDGTQQQGQAPVLLTIPDSAAGTNVAGNKQAGPTALAVLVPPNGAPKVMAPASGATLDTLDETATGAPRFAGRAPAGAKLHLFVDGGSVGEARADTQGNWSVVLSQPLSPGAHTLRLDQLASNGAVTARVNQSFQAPGTRQDATQLSRAVVQPGQSLWRLAHTAYGDGGRFVLIFHANQGQISNPNLIYPGQVFAVPAAVDPPGSATPTSSRRSR